MHCVTHHDSPATKPDDCNAVVCTDSYATLAVKWQLNAVVAVDPDNRVVRPEYKH